MKIGNGLSGMRFEVVPADDPPKVVKMQRSGWVIGDYDQSLGAYIMVTESNSEETKSPKAKRRTAKRPKPSPKRRTGKAGIFESEILAAMGKSWTTPTIIGEKIDRNVGSVKSAMSRLTKDGILENNGKPSRASRYRVL